MVQPNDNSRKLADDYYAIKLEIAAAEVRQAAIRQQIIESGLSVIEGQTAVVTVDLSDISRLDQIAVRRFLTPKQMADCTTSKKTVFVRVKPKPKVK